MKFCVARVQTSRTGGKGSTKLIAAVTAHLTRAGNLASEIVRAVVEGIGSDDDDAKICELLTVEDLSECFAEVSLVSVPRSDTHPPAGLACGSFFGDDPTSP